MAHRRSSERALATILGVGLALASSNVRSRPIRGEVGSDYRPTRDAAETLLMISTVAGIFALSENGRLAKRLRRCGRC